MSLRRAVLLSVLVSVAACSHNPERPAMTSPTGPTVAGGAGVLNAVPGSLLTAPGAGVRKVRRRLSITRPLVRFLRTTDRRVSRCVGPFRDASIRRSGRAGRLDSGVRALHRQRLRYRDGYGAGIRAD